MKNKYLNKNGDLIFRPSSLGKIMASGKKTNELSAGAKTYIKDIWKKVHLDYDDSLSGKEIDKGTNQEHEGIALLNLYLDQEYTKNEITAENDYLRGTADIVTHNSIRDIKLPYSKKTHPVFKEDGQNSMYEWQLRGYMMLYDKDTAYLDYCLIQTKDKFIPNWEPLNLHMVNDLPLDLRITTLEFKRDLHLEMQIIERIKLCRIEYKKLSINRK